MERNSTSFFHHSIIDILIKLSSSINDVLELEIEAGGTRFAATGDSKSAFLGLMNGTQWMIYENTVTGVLHWDFVSLSICLAKDSGRFINYRV